MKSRIIQRAENRAVCSTETSRLASQRRKCRELTRSRTITRDIGTKHGRILRILKKVYARVRVERNGKFMGNEKKSCGEKEEGEGGSGADAKD